MNPLKAEYEAIPYEDAAFPHAHPGLLAAIGALFGMTPAPVERCRVLEVGCASGTNLLPLAGVLPESEFVGIDLASVHIERARSLADAAGLKNVTLHAIDLREFDTGEDKFDFIIAHGVYSWVPDEVKAALLELCARGLTAQGIAYISYNVYPGWSLRKPLRDVMRMKMQRVSGFEARICAAREVLDFIDDALQPMETAYALMIREQIKLIRQRRASSVYYDEVAPVNDPCCFEEFIRAAHSAGLQYLGDSVLSSMFHDKFSLDPGGKLKGLGLDCLQIEQLLDVVHSRSFRTTLLCRPEVKLHREMAGGNVRRLCVRSCLKAPEGAHLGSDGAVQFQAASGRGVKSAEPWTKAFLHFLTQQSPRFVRWEVAAAHATKTAGEASQGRMESLLADAELLTTYCLANDMMQASTFAIALPLEVPEYPRVTPVAREQARRGNAVVNLLQEVCPLDEAHRESVARLDGSQPRDKHCGEILEHLRALSLLLPAS